MTTKRIIYSIICIAGLMATMSCNGSKSGQSEEDSYTYPDSLQDIRGLVIDVNDYTAEWCKGQADGWEAMTEEHPSDERAWKNYYLATSYYTSLANAEGRDSILSYIKEEAEEAIPDTYVYYYIAYNVATIEGDKEQRSKYAEEAIKMIPDNANAKDYETWMSYLYDNAYIDGTESPQRFREFAKRFYDSGVYSEEQIAYDMNELACMENDGIYICSGDAEFDSKILIQEGMGLHKDKLVLVYDFFLIPEFCQHVYDELGIGLVPERTEERNYRNFYEHEQKVIGELARRTGRPLYLSKAMATDRMSLWKEASEGNELDDIGLMYKCTPGKPVDKYTDCQEMARHFENDMNFDYLKKPLGDDAWGVDIARSASVVFNFSPLFMYWYYHVEDEGKHAKQVEEVLRRALERMPDCERKQSAQEYFDFYKNKFYVE